MRFPNLRFASVENGSAFLPGLLNAIKRALHKDPQYFSDHDPLETFKQHVWINPFWEDDVHDIVEMMGADRVIFGSDYPHVEGLPRPLDYEVEVKEFDEADQRRIMFENTSFLNTPQPA